MVCALSRAVRALGKKHGVDVIIYDVGPNVGPLNRTVLMDVDFFATPVAADLFSLRALSTVGRSLARWITDWSRVRMLAGPEQARSLLKGSPVYLGYITSAYKVSSGREATQPHEHWEKRIASRVVARVVNELKKVNAQLVPHQSNKIASIKNFQSLAPQAQKHSVAIGKLKGFVNNGYNAQVYEAAESFELLGRELLKRMQLEPKTP